MQPHFCFQRNELSHWKKHIFSHRNSLYLNTPNVLYIKTLTAPSDIKQDGSLCFFPIDLNSSAVSRTSYPSYAHDARRIPSFLRATLSNKIEITALWTRIWSLQRTNAWMQLQNNIAILGCSLDISIIRFFLF